MPVSQVQRIRGKLQLSQSKFAALLGISVRTLQGWEQGRYEPNAAAVALLKLAESGIGRRSRRKVGNDALTLSPGREATPEELARWHAEIVRFIEVVQSHKLNVLGGAEYLRCHHPLSDEAVAWLAWWAKEQGVTQYKSETTTRAGKAFRIPDALHGIILCLLHDSPKDDTAAVFTKFRALAADSNPHIMEVVHGDTAVRWLERPLSSDGAEEDIETPRSDITNRIHRTREKLHSYYRKHGREALAAEVTKLKKRYGLREE
jgi:transcriptional regulator with XRE-family HTH domain